MKKEILSVGLYTRIFPLKLCIFSDRMLMPRIDQSYYLTSPKPCCCKVTFCIKLVFFYIQLKVFWRSMRRYKPECCISMNENAVCKRIKHSLPYCCIFQTRSRSVVFTYTNMLERQAHPQKETLIFYTHLYDSLVQKTAYISLDNTVWSKTVSYCRICQNVDPHQIYFLILKVFK